MTTGTDQNGNSINWVFAAPPERIGEDAALALLSAAVRARETAYAPYSSFKVGAAVLTQDGHVITGANVENASYGATVCAERVALFAAIASGSRAIRAIAVVAQYPRPIPPCGICRQVIAEFAQDADIVMANMDGAVTIASIKTLLPNAFDTYKPQSR